MSVLPDTDQLQTKGLSVPNLEIWKVLPNMQEELVNVVANLLKRDVNAD